MDDTPFYKKPWFYIFGWLVILLLFYGWQVLSSTHQVKLIDVLIDLACVFPALLLLWMAFFAQFVLPVRTFRDRQKIFDRLITSLFGGHGPAIFIRNGQLVKREGEERKKGPGVLWLDSASAAVTRTAVKIKQTLGPGVHFIESKEYIAGTVDLHIQSQKVGPKETEKPFDDQSDDQSDEEYQQIQDRRRMVSALTRDGIEVVPNISISFRVDTGFPKEGEPGSRFGYRTGITRKAKENESKDKEAIRKAILGEGINPNVLTDSHRRRVAWNELPVSLAVDVWREYASKFTLDDLFKPEQLVPPPPPELPQPTDDEIDPLSQPVQVTANRSNLQDSLAKLLREVNLILSKTIRRLEEKPEDDKAKKAGTLVASLKSPASTANNKEPVKKTGIQVITEMVNDRLKKADVDILDDNGKREKGAMTSPEYKLLKDRGIVVQSVGISDLRFGHKIDETIIERWSATWLKNAKAEEKQIERRRNIVESSGQEKAIIQYANLLSHELNRKKPVGVKETLKTLIMQTRTIIIRNDDLRKDMALEQEMLEEILRWIEVNE